MRKLASNKNTILQIFALFSVAPGVSVAINGDSDKEMQDFKTYASRETLAEFKKNPQYPWQKIVHVASEIIKKNCDKLAIVAGTTSNINTGVAITDGTMRDTYKIAATAGPLCMSEGYVERNGLEGCIAEVTCRELRKHSQLLKSGSEAEQENNQINQ